MSDAEYTAKRIVREHAPNLSEAQQEALISAIAAAIAEHVQEERRDNALEAKNYK